MSITSAIENAHRDNGVIDISERASIYEEVLRQSPRRNETRYLLNENAFRALMQGRFRTDEEQGEFYQGLLESFKQRKLHEIQTALSQMSIAERVELLRCFPSSATPESVNGRLYIPSDFMSTDEDPNRPTNSPRRTPQEESLAKGILQAIAIFLGIAAFPVWPAFATGLAFPDYAHSGTTPLRDFLQRIFGTSNSYSYSYSPRGENLGLRSITIQDGLGQTPLQDPELEETRAHLPHEIQISMSEIRQLIIDSLRGERLASSQGSVSTQIGGGYLGGSGFTQVRTDLTLALGRSIRVEEQASLLHQFTLLLGAAYYSSASPLAGANTPSLVAARAGMGYSLTRQSRSSLYPAWSLNPRLTVSLLPQLENPALVFSPELNANVRIFGRMFFTANGGGDFSATLGNGWHAGAGLGFYL